MQFLKILFWCLIAVTAAVFAQGNWTSVPIHLPGQMVAETNLPFLLLLVFLLGLLPTLAWQHARRWRLRQRLAAAERQLAELRALPPTPVAAPVAPVTTAPPVAADTDSATGPGALL